MAVATEDGRTVLSVAFNDGTNNDEFIEYTETRRHVYAGASLMGWAYSTDEGASWTYGGKVEPPMEDGWVILWGDPAMTASAAHRNVVYMSNLAVPAEKYPEGGIEGSMGVNSPLGGACIAKSTNGGRDFHIWQCITNDHHFYDGGNMAAGPDGSVYASFIDVNTQQIDVWRAAGDDSEFERLPSPFSGVNGHPRIRVDQGTGTLYVAADVGGVVRLTWWKGDGWANPLSANFSVYNYPRIRLNDTVLRTGPQFTFDVIGPEQVPGTEWPIRLVYTARDPDTHRFYLRASKCRFQGEEPKCKDVPGWATGKPGKWMPPGDNFNPILRAYWNNDVYPPKAIWKLSYTSRDHDPNGSTVAWKEGNLTELNGAAVFLAWDLVDPHEVCPTTGGYWGDYDDMQVFRDQRERITFIRAFSDSSQGCELRWKYTSKHLHVSTVRFQ